ncbi:glycosyltransferase family 39 protein [Pseudarthrobacter sp. P1]|uniref:glycosyltransferase family 39 protein n=1 Tax=Pseudarthrobacter sp. P1 TaxID=3418418 RepID=UPI003CF1715A
MLDIAIPVFNEEASVEGCLHRLHHHLSTEFSQTFCITVADNASTDSTLAVAERVARELPGIRVVHLDEKGRGNALRTVWLGSPSPVLAYMDVDLSTDLAALVPLVSALLSGHSDLAIGTRLAYGAQVVRGPKREFISRSYNILLHSTLGAHFSDAQCGFKAIRADVAAALLPHTLDNAWFFDTELLVLAERCGLRVLEIPVDWVDDPQSSVDILPTAMADLRGMVRLGRDMVSGRIPVPELRAALGRGPLAGAPAGPPAWAPDRSPGGQGGPVSRPLFHQLVRFGAIGAASTLVYLLLFVAGRTFLDAQLANFAALLISAVANTAANRRFTFGIRGGTAARAHFEGMLVFGIGLALTSGSLAALHALGEPGRTVEVLSVVAANLAATIIRFLLFRHWVWSSDPANGRTTPKEPDVPSFLATPAHPTPGQLPSPTGSGPSNDGGPRRRRLARLAFGNQARWIRPSAAAMLVGTALLYLWNITISGYGNSFYAAAVQAGTKNWTALLFGSLDAGNAITVDKPPASLWIPALLGRVFGFSSATVLVPQALMGVAAVGLLYAAVKRTGGAAAGLIAGCALALTPVAALMFRFDNPDALLSLLLVLAAYATLRAIEKPGWTWLAVAGAVIGLAFLAKMLQGFVIVPALALAYFWAAPVGWGRRLAHLGAAAAGIVLVAGSYVALFQLTPAGQRPYMAGSRTNSFLELTFGYNGLARILGNDGGPGGGVRSGVDFGGAAPGGFGGAPAGGFGGAGGGGSAFGGSPGILRMFGNTFGGEVSWLLPAALILLAALLWTTRREHRSSLLRASAILWGGWLVLTAGIFSFMSGTIHPYYAVALAPAIAALVGLGSVQLWRRRSHWAARSTLALVVLASALWSAVLLSRDASFLPWLKYAAVALGILSAAGLAFRVDRFKRATAALAITSILAAGLGSTAWSLATVGVGHTGAIPTSGPASAASFGGGPGGLAGAAWRFRDGVDASGTRPGNGGRVQPSGGGAGAGDLAPQPGRTTGGAGAGGFLGDVANAQLTALSSSTTTKWSAIVSGSSEAASLELASNTAVIALGGFSGTDPYPTLAQFQDMVANGQVSYFISGGMGAGRMPFGGGSSAGTGAGSVAAWVAANFTAQTVGSTTVYKLAR